MTIRRSRRASRLLSGLLAGAMVCGGLAMSGGSPVSAANPIWNVSKRIGGVDRYETAVLVAEDLDTPEVLSAIAVEPSIIIASGENPADALAASAIVREVNAPVLLVKKNAIPEVVSEYLNSKADADFAGDVYVLGGEEAISEDVFDAIADILADADVTRVAGDDRYETAAEINAMLSGPDGAIIVNGADGRWPDALSVGQIAAVLGWPIIVTGNGGLNETASNQIDELLLDNEDAQFLLVGGTAVLPASVEQYLRDADVAQGSIRRLGGADRYQTNVLVNAYILEGGTPSAVTTAPSVYGSLYGFGVGWAAGVGVTLVSGESPWDALTANSWTTRGIPYHLMLVRPTSVPAITGVALDLLAQMGGPQEVWIIGGRAAVADSVRTAVFDAIDTDVAAPTVAGCFESSPILTLNYSGLDVETIFQNGESNLIVDVNGEEVPTFSNFGALYADTRATEDGDIVAVTIASELGLYEEDHNWSVAFMSARDTDDDGFGDNWITHYLAEDDEILIDTRHSDNFQIVGTAECVVPDDDTAPTITVDAREGAGIFVTASEPVYTGAVSILNLTTGEEFGLADIGGALGVPVPTSTSSLTLADLTEASTGWFIPMISLVENDRVVVEAGSFGDLADNPTDVDASDRTSADSTEPTLTVLASVCTNFFSPMWVLGESGIAIIKNNMLAELVGAYSGPAGNEWTVDVVDDRGGDTVTVVADDTEKTLTITADLGRSTAADLHRAFLDAGLGGLFGGWTVSLPLFGLVESWSDVLPEGIDGEIDLMQSGVRDCTVVLSGGEPTLIDWADSDLVSPVGGAVTPVDMYLDTHIIELYDLTDASSEVEINFGTAPSDRVGNEADDRWIFTI